MIESKGGIFLVDEGIVVDLNILKEKRGERVGGEGEKEKKKKKKKEKKTKRKEKKKHFSRQKNKEKK